MRPNSWNYSPHTKPFIFQHNIFYIFLHLGWSENIKQKAFLRGTYYVCIYTYMRYINVSIVPISWFLCLVRDANYLQQETLVNTKLLQLIEDEF